MEAQIALHRGGIQLDKQHFIAYINSFGVAGHWFTDQLFPGCNNTGFVKFGFEVILLQEAFDGIAYVLDIVSVLRHLIMYKLTTFYGDNSRIQVHLPQDFFAAVGASIADKQLTEHPFCDQF